MFSAAVCSLWRCGRNTVNTEGRAKEKARDRQDQNMEAGVVFSSIIFRAIEVFEVF